MMKRLALLTMFASGCQSFGAFSQPDTLPDGALRVGVVATDDSFQVTDERLNSVDLGLTASLGLSDRTELDAFASTSTVQLGVKRALIEPGTVALAASVGAGLFTAFTSHTSALYVPASLVAGVHPSHDVCLFLGPQLWSAIALDPPGQGAGFNRSDFGFLAGGVAGLALEDPRFTFVPQLAVLTPVVSGAQGTVVQVSFAFGTQAADHFGSPSK